MNRSIVLSLLVCLGHVPVKDQPQIIPVLTLEEAKEALWEALEHRPEIFGAVGREPGRTDLREGRLEVVALNLRESFEGVAALLSDRVAGGIGAPTWRIDLNHRTFAYCWGTCDCRGEFTYRDGRWQAQVKWWMIACH